MFERIEVVRVDKYKKFLIFSFDRKGNLKIKQFFRLTVNSNEILYPYYIE